MLFGLGIRHVGEQVARSLAAEFGSLDRLQLVTAMEDEFDLEIDDDKLAAINSVADAVDAIESAQEA